MADTRRLQGLKALASAIDGVDKPAGLTVHRRDQRPFLKDALPAAVVFGGEGSSADRGGQLLDNTDRYFVELRVIGNADTPPDDTIDPFFSWVWQAVMVDLRLGGAVAHTRVVGWDRPPAVEKDQVYIGMVIEFEVTYQTRRDNPELAA